MNGPKVTLAAHMVGTNLNYLDEITTKLPMEGLVASAARISRKKDSIDKIRIEAFKSPEKCAKTIKNVAWTLHHESVLEHAVFTFDIENVSRLLVETIESLRLCSYTEKSQRYVKFQDNYHNPFQWYIPNTPQEQKEIGLLSKEYDILVSHMFNTYDKLVDNGVPKEDARYITPLSTTTQLTMTMNARDLNKFITKLSKQSSEGLLVAEQVLHSIYRLFPSLLKHDNIQDYITEESASNLYELLNNRKDDITLINDHLHVFRVLRIDNIEKCLEHLVQRVLELMPNDYYQFTDDEKLINLQTALDLVIEHVKKEQLLPREFEFGGIEFKAAISASCFAQLKRHRMMSLLYGSYNTKLDQTIPLSIMNENINVFMNMIHRIDAFYERMNKYVDGQYILTNAHNRIVHGYMNYRQFFTMCLLRLDKHAQWDIKNLISKLKTACINSDSCTGFKSKRLFEEVFKGNHEFIQS